mmetsp:Transcript_5052/g.8433  ORF Transcript_5052/g.8433 Transcript_5052/m.8433 type:complete len:290 (+) Transcript_5052:223-1092(+)
MMREASSSSFFATSAGVRSSSSAMERCSSGVSRLYSAQKSPSTTPLSGKYEERYTSWSRPERGGASCLRCISSACVSSRSSLEAKGSRAPTPPMIVVYSSTSAQPGPSVTFCSEVTVSPTWNCTSSSALHGAPLSERASLVVEERSCASSTSSDTSCGSRVTKMLPNLSAPARVLTSSTAAAVSQRGEQSSAKSIREFSCRLYLTKWNDSARSPTTTLVEETTWIDWTIVGSPLSSHLRSSFFLPQSYTRRRLPTPASSRPEKGARAYGTSSTCVLCTSSRVVLPLANW